MKRLWLPLLALTHISALGQSNLPTKTPSSRIASELDAVPTPPVRPKNNHLPAVIFLKKPTPPGTTAPSTASAKSASPSEKLGAKPSIGVPLDLTANANKPKPKFPMCSEGHYTDNPKEVASMFGDVLGFQHALNQEVIENGPNNTRVLLASQGGKLQFKIDLNYQGFPVSLYAPGKLCLKDNGSLLAVVATSEAKKRDWMLASSGEVADSYRVTISRVNSSAVRLSEPTGKLNNIFTSR